jgi:hypothetical protein
MAEPKQLKAIKGGLNITKRLLADSEEAGLTAAQRAEAGRKAAELIKSQPQVKASEALGQLMEKGFKKTTTTQADRTRVGGGNIGGAPFPAISEADPAYKGKVWGVMDEGTAARLKNLTDPETAWTTMLGSASQLKTNPIVFDKLKRGFVDSMKRGNLSDELAGKINHNLALTFGEGADIRDPKIWRQADTFEKRAALADVMMGQGTAPSKGGVAIGGEKSGKGVIFKPTDILKRETEPSLLHTEHGGDVPTFAAGPRLFRLNKESVYDPTLHPGFPTLLTGEDLKINMKPTPTEVYLRDWHQKFKKDNPERKGPGYYDLALGVKGEGLPSQELNDEYIRHLLREGFKKGGAVDIDAADRRLIQAMEKHMAKGGEVDIEAADARLSDAITKRIGMAQGGEAGFKKIQFMDKGGRVGRVASGIGKIAKRLFADEKPAPAVIKPSSKEANDLARKRASLPKDKGGLGLPPNNTAEQRAQAMGYDKDVYHGTSEDFTSFKGDQPIFTTEDPDIAKLYGKNIYPLKTRGEEMTVSDLTDEGHGHFAENLAKKLGLFDEADQFKNSDKRERELINALKERGIDRLKITDMSDMGGVQTQHALPAGSENIRSRNAAFDPFRRSTAIATSMGVAAPDLMAEEVDKAEGGGAFKKLQFMAEGGKAGKFGKLAEGVATVGKKLLDSGEAAPKVDRLSMSYKDVTKRVPEVADALEQLVRGEITKAQYNDIVKLYKPVTPYTFVPKPATKDEAVGALRGDAAKERYGKQSEYEPGSKVGLRLDIPAYTGKGVWVNSIHNEKAKKVAYGPTASVKNADLSISQAESKRIALGGAKAPYARIKGEWNPMSDEEAIAKAQEYLNHPEWRQIGMDPERHSYFYDRATMLPITNAEEIIQIGPLVLGKNPKFANIDDFEYAKGGYATMLPFAKGGKIVKGGLNVAKRLMADNSLPTIERDANLAKFLEPSKVQQRLYHGTGQGDISAFKSPPRKKVPPGYMWGQKGDETYNRGVFLSPNPEMANHFAKRGTKLAEDDAGQYAVYPVRAQVERPFDYENPEHREILAQFFQKQYNDWHKANPEAKRMPDVNMEYLLDNPNMNFQAIESPEMLHAIERLGFDSFYTSEGKAKNIGVFDPRKIKSDIGNRGTYDINDADLTKAHGGLAMAGGGRPPVKNESLQDTLKNIQNYSVLDQGAKKPNELSGVVLAGASWMAGDEKTRLAREAFGQDVTNTAIGGQKTSDVLNQLNVFERDGGTFAKGTTVVLDIGANDIAQGVDKDTIRKNLNEIVSRLGDSGVNVILSGQPEANSYDEAIKSTNLQMDSLYNDIAKNNSNVTLVDAMSGMLNDKTLMDESGFHLKNEDAKLSYLNQFADAYKATINQGTANQDETGIPKQVVQVMQNDNVIDIPQEIAQITQTSVPETYYTPEVISTPEVVYTPEVVSTPAVVSAPAVVESQPSAGYTYAQNNSSIDNYYNVINDYLAQERSQDEIQAAMQQYGVSQADIDAARGYQPSGGGKAIEQYATEQYANGGSAFKKLEFAQHFDGGGIASPEEVNPFEGSRREPLLTKKDLENIKRNAPEVYEWAKQNVKDEASQLRSAKGAKDFALRVGAQYAGAIPDLVNLGLMLPDAVAGTNLSSEKPWFGSEQIIDAMHRAGMLGENEFPISETVAGVLAPAGLIKKGVKKGYQAYKGMKPEASKKRRGGLAAMSR